MTQMRATDCDPETRVTFVGASACIPSPGGETASFLVNGPCLVDLGWNAVLRARDMGFDPLAIETVIVTHWHHDHYMGLAPFLFYRGMVARNRRRTEVPALAVIGPADGLETMVERAKQLLQVERYPELDVPCELDPFEPGDERDIGAFHLATCPARHESASGRTVDVLALRFTNHATGRCFAYSGDTSYHPPMADFARDADVLIHDAAHTRAGEAARMARAAGVGRLLLIHYERADADALLTEARDVFANTDLAREGETVRPGGADDAREQTD